MAAPVDAQAPPRNQGCVTCHGDIEFLRQQARSLERARELLVSTGEVAASAHGEMACAECHTGYDRFPHPSRASTASCESCHEEAHSAWQESVHAGQENLRIVRCAACHTIHRVLPADTLRTPAGAAVMNASCVSCHEAARLPEGTAHAGKIGCAQCHGSHAIHAVADTRSAVAPARQYATCGACHDTIAATARQDAHGAAVMRWSHPDTVQLLTPDVVPPPACTGCHDAHRMRPAGTAEFEAAMVERCSACHEDYAETYLGTYHGKATALGSVIAATCADCHTAHRIHPASDPRSSVAAANLVATCGTCHEHARPAFVQYDSHPTLDYDRNPWIFFSFWFMNGLLLFVVVVFGAHTALWWVRLMLDRRKERGHVTGGHA